MKNTYKSVLTTILATSTLFCFSSIQADEMVVPVSQQAQDIQSLERPANGQSMQRVESTYGQPILISGPVGEPPITTWEYEQFKVYFERNLVIHSVLKHN